MKNIPVIAAALVLFAIPLAYAAEARTYLITSDGQTKLSAVISVAPGQTAVFDNMKTTTYFPDCSNGAEKSSFAYAVPVVQTGTAISARWPRVGQNPNVLEINFRNVSTDGIKIGTLNNCVVSAPNVRAFENTSQLNMSLGERESLGRDSTSSEAFFIERVK
jgi:hypothetical protein